MTKTLALLLDSYRELNSKKLFWITLILSGVVVLAMACIGVNHGQPFGGRGPGGRSMGDLHITIVGWTSPIPAAVFGVTDPESLYKLLFSSFGVGFWLSIIGTILGLASTAGLFPDFMAGGSIDLYLSKPISRLRLFLTKYMGGLLFVTLQMSVFSVASFLLLGVRGHDWEPAVFLSIPLVVLMFSYLFSFCVLLGVLTRSTIAALILTILFWFILWGVQKTESVLTLFQTIKDVQESHEDKELARDRQELPTLPDTVPSGTISSQPVYSRGPGGRMTFEPRPQTKSAMQARISELEGEKASRSGTLDTVALVVRCVQAPLPKTGATTKLLDRELIKRAKLPPSDTSTDDPMQSEETEEESDRREASVSAWYIIGTSLAFELAAIGLAAWRFCSRDY